jgi:hypothetical protein
MPVFIVTINHIVTPQSIDLLFVILTNFVSILFDRIKALGGGNSPLLRLRSSYYYVRCRLAISSLIRFIDMRREHEVMTDLG